ncbi:cobaltochelatase subunit CobN [Methanobacterium ferruginis]|uniref:cobaltochelatase subunit CobN n=1 Tax=Methanobacterium ferruginis TaxID=710191 RepID=UPI002573C7E6|nr:cobaltochelatase subunit CobN [Methanobacterium ferruginis]BDZ68139.1 protoporphyrin IX magnesium chelatase [Methanobacterium ferruginis]
MTIVFALLLCGAVSAEDSQGGEENNSSDLPRIAIISSYPNNVITINNASTDPEISGKLNVTAYSGRTVDNLTSDSYNLSDCNVIVLENLIASVMDSVTPTVLEARNNGAYVIAIGDSTAAYNLQNVNTQDAKYSDLPKYFQYPSTVNLQQMLLFLGVNFCNITATVKAPETGVLEGIYHPDAPMINNTIKIFNNLTDYLAWYTSTSTNHYVYNSSNPTVGIITSKYSDMARDGPLIDALVRSFESNNVNVIVGTYVSANRDSINYFIKDGVPFVDAMIVISMGATLNSQNLTLGIEDLQKLNVPVIDGIRLFNSNVSAWEESPYGVPTSELYQIAYAESDGIIEPIVISAKETNPETGKKYNQPIDYQIAWLTQRTISWMDLRRKDNWEKKIVITYYSEGGGKANVGADIDYYLDTPASLAKLLEALKERGYNVGNGPLPTATELATLMAQIGSNVGTWAPGELEKRVQNGNVILIPEAMYLQWFSELPADKQAEMIESWGLAPGKLMVYENETGKYIVIPKIQYGNILLVPEPVWGWLQDNSTLYNTGTLPPTHDCLAFYFWINKVYGADAIFSIFSIVELMPGKQVGLSAHDWGAILIQDMPMIHVLPMDAEGIFDRRRANMLIIDFMTPILIPSGLYGDLADLDQDISFYNSAVDDTLKGGYKEDIINKTRSLGIDQALGINLDNVSSDTSLFEAFLGSLKTYLQDLKTTYMPYGSHTLGETPNRIDPLNGTALVAMVEAMLGDEYKDEVAAVNPLDGLTTALLSEVLINNLTPEAAQNKVLGTVSTEVTKYLNLALNYASRISNCGCEITRILDALEGKYILPGKNGDPVRNPDALPTGRNLYTFDSRTVPTERAWDEGVELAKQLVDDQLQKTGSYPQKVAFVLWSVETSRHQGIMESEIFYLLGVKLVRDSKGRVKDVELIDSTVLGRPRIDVVITVSGLYRDMYSDLVKLLDKAVRLAAQAKDTEYPNYVKEHSEAIYQALLNEGYSEDEARSLSMSRVFSESPGAYTPGIQEVIPASETWDGTDEVADFYLERMSYVYGNDGWGQQSTSLFEKVLNGVEICEFSRSSNVYGVLDHPMVAAYLGGLGMAIERVSGKYPEMYINNLRESGEYKIETLNEFFNRDILTRYLNPTWINGMMGHGQDGTRYMDTFVEDLWMWQVTTPGLVTENTWNMVYETYILDKNNMGLKDYFNTNNPYAKQSMLARMVETIRKGYWNPSEEVKTALINEFIQSVNEYGVTCCHHTCGNLVLNQMMVTGSTLSMEQLQQYAAAYASATGKSLNMGTPGSTPQSGSAQATSGASSPVGASSGNEAATESGSTSSSASEPASESAGTEGTSKSYEVSETDSSSNSQSSMPIVAIVGVILLVALVGVGYFRNSIFGFFKK